MHYYPVPQFKAEEIARKFNELPKTSATVIGNGMNCFVKVVSTRPSRPRSWGGPSIEMDMVEVVGWRQKRHSPRP